MSPLDQALLKAFSNTGRTFGTNLPPSESLSLPRNERATDNSRGTSAAILADLQTTVANQQASCLGHGTERDTGRRITLSEAIALRRTQTTADTFAPEQCNSAVVVSAGDLRHCSTASVEFSVSSGEADLDSKSLPQSGVGQVDQATDESFFKSSDSIPTSRNTANSSVFTENTYRGEAKSDRSDTTTSAVASNLAPCNTKAPASVSQDEERHQEPNDPLADQRDLGHTGQPQMSSSTTTASTATSQAGPQAASADDGQPESDLQVSSAEETILRLLRPLIRLERFAWPSLVSRWIRGCPGEIDRVVDLLERCARREQRVIGFTACRPGEGVSSVVLAVGRGLTRRRSRFVMVEAHWEAPQFVKRLALLNNDGWEAVLEGRRTADEVMVETENGRAAVLPCVRAPVSGIDPGRVAETFEMLRQNYDTVLIDLPPRARLPESLARLCDAVIFVQDPRLSSTAELERYAQFWETTGATPLGVIRNG